MLGEPVVGLALSSGGARGLAHIGALMALEENNIPIHMIAGCSAGSLIGCLFACGISAKKIGDIAMNVDRKLWLDITVPRKGFIKGDKVEELIRILTRNRNIEDLDIPFAAVATDLKTSEKVVFTEGPISKAVRASISVPGVFEPVNMGDRVLVDGAIIDRVPASLLREMGCDTIIAVDVGFGMAPSSITHIIDVILLSLDVMTRGLTERSKIEADVLIEPSLTHINGTKFNLVEECVEIGYNSTMGKMDEIKKAIRKRSLELGS